MAANMNEVSGVDENVDLPDGALNNTSGMEPGAGAGDSVVGDSQHHGFALPQDEEQNEDAHAAQRDSSGPSDPANERARHQTSQQTHNKTDSYSAPEFAEEGAQYGEYPLSAGTSQQQASPNAQDMAG